MGGGQTSLLRRRLMPALLLVVPSAAALSASTGIVQAVEECRLEPGWPAPSGSKWLSRINRDHHRCWFLSSRATGHHAQFPRAGSVRNRHLAGAREAARPDQQRDSDLQTASAPTEKTDRTVATEPPAVPQLAASTVQQSSESLVPHSVPTIAYRLLPPSAQTVSGPTAVGARTVEPQPAGASKSNVVLLAGAAAVGLLFAAGAFHVTRRVHLRSRTRAIADRHGVRGPVAVRSSVVAKPSPMMADPVEGLKTSLRELGHHLKPTLQACNIPSSHRTDSSSGAISLPPAAAWLTRPKAQLPAEQKNRQLAEA